MNAQNRMGLLQQIYDIHDTLAMDTQTACHKGCATCCTCNVTATTLESIWIYNYLMDADRGRELTTITTSLPMERFQPKATINEMATLCAQGHEPPEETYNPLAGTCPFLKDDICSIYPVRPLGCRAMLSLSDCSLSGQAQMPPFILAANNVIMQYLEAIDQPGGTGNLLDVLKQLLVGEHRDAYLSKKGPGNRERVRPNQSIGILMVPPDQRQPVTGLIQSLNKAIQKSKPSL